jgi:Salmonella virulence plasmid 65kDa B protein/FG-GAP-like repeat
MNRPTLNTTKSSRLIPLMWMLCLIALSTFISILTPTTAQAATPFTTNANFSVGSDGSANYSIPIQVPPGTAGMAPTLSLNYNSNGGNGILGMGWGLDGLSQISRCPKTIIQDGAVGGVNYDVNDKLCIDGQRLISTGGTYGANATEYRTEQANFAKIISTTTTPANGPDSFKVWTKAGQVIEYGNTTDSRIEAAAKTIIKTWGVNKISDTKGNYITITYTEDNPNGEAYIQRIDYTGNATSTPALAPYANIQFIYEARPDTTTDYVAGTVIKRTKRITNIKTYLGTTLIKDYRVTYSNIGAYSTGAVFNTSTYEYNKNGTLITQIIECDASSVCLQPTVFNWQIGTVLNGNVGLFAGSIASPGQITAIGDVDGDGLNDIVYVTAPASIPPATTGTVYYAKNTGTGFSTIGTSFMTTTRTCTASGSGLNITTTCSNWSVHPAFLADVSGDGKADLLWGNQVRLSNGSGFDVAYTLIGTAGGKVTSVGDINGDGKTDILFATNSTSTSGIATIRNSTNYYAMSNGSSLLSPTLLGSYTTSTTCPIIGGGACTTTVTSSSGIVGGLLGDFNGDGLADIAKGANVYKSSGNSFAAAEVWVTGAGPIFGVVDYDGNGLSDVLYSKVAGAGFGARDLILGVSDGKAFKDAFTVISQPCATSIGLSGCGGWPPIPDNLFIKDLNYDGLGDFVSGSVIKPAVLTLPDLLVGINVGLDSAVAITNQKLPASVNGTPVYISDSGTAAAAVYPNLDILAISPSYVVSTATVTDGNGGVLTNNYNYGGLKAHLTGRGSLGFRYQKVSQVDPDVNSTTFFRQDYPYIGLPCQTEKRITSSNTLIGASALTYANAPITTGTAISQFPYLSQSVEQNFELINTGTPINTTTTTNQYDTYGNATQISVNSGDGYIKTTTNVYNNDSTNWFLGRLLKSTVTSTSP